MEIWQMPATDVARGVRTRAFSAQEATRSVLDRVTEVNPAVNALVEVRETEALTAARRADEVGRVAEPSYRRFFDSMYEVYQQVFGDVGLEEFVAGWARRGLLRREMSLFMDRLPLVMTPVSGEPPFPMGSDVESTERTAELMARQWPLMSVPVLGLPALAMGVVPTGGAPLGIQLIGRPFDEEAVFGAAEVIEARSAITTPVEPAMSGTRSCLR